MLYRVTIEYSICDHMISPENWDRVETKEIEHVAAEFALDVLKDSILSRNPDAIFNKLCSTPIRSK